MANAPRLKPIVAGFQMNPKASYVLSVPETFLLTHSDSIPKEYLDQQHTYLQYLHASQQLPVLEIVGMPLPPLFHHCHQFDQRHQHLCHHLRHRR